MRAYINNDSGSGKTLFIAILCLLYAELNPTCHIFANFHLNIYNKKTNKKMTTFSKFGLIPYSRIEKGFCLIALDDFYALRNSDFYTSILAILSRRQFIEVYLSIQYYTDITKRVRHLCQFEIVPFLSDIQNDFLTKESELELRFYNPKSMDLISMTTLYNILDLLENGKDFENVYVKGNLYSTFELVEFDNYTKVIEYISEISENFDDIEVNANIYYKNERKKDKLINDCCNYKGIVNKLKAIREK